MSGYIVTFRTVLTVSIPVEVGDQQDAVALARTRAEDFMTSTTGQFNDISITGKLDDSVIVREQHEE